jgi:hypothetical protein
MIDHELKYLEVDRFMGCRAHCTCTWVSAWEEDVGDAIAEHDAHQRDEHPPIQGAEMPDAPRPVRSGFPSYVMKRAGSQPRRFLRRGWSSLLAGLLSRRLPRT